MITKCQYQSGNHSDDLVMIHHGRSTPTLLCGYHNSWQLDMSNPNIKRSNA